MCDSQILHVVIPEVTNEEVWRSMHMSCSSVHRLGTKAKTLCTGYTPRPSFEVVWLQIKCGSRLLHVSFTKGLSKMTFGGVLLMRNQVKEVWTSAFYAESSKGSLEESVLCGIKLGKFE